MIGPPPRTAPCPGVAPPGCAVLENGLAAGALIGSPVVADVAALPEDAVGAALVAGVGDVVLPGVALPMLAVDAPRPAAPHRRRLLPVLLPRRPLAMRPHRRLRDCR